MKQKIFIKSNFIILKKE